MIERISRRSFLDYIALYSALSVTSLLTTSCTPQSEKDSKLAQAKEELIRGIKEQYGMEIKKRFELSSSGIWINVLTDNTLEINQQEVEKAFLAEFNILDSLPKSASKEILKMAEEGLNLGKFRGREVFLLVPSDPEKCIGKEYAIVSIPPEGAEGTCSTNAFSGTIILARPQELENGITPEYKLTIIFLTAVAEDGQTTFYPADSRFVLTPEQAVSSGLSHEATHVFFRMLGIPQGGEIEEDFVQKIEENLLKYYQQHPEERPLPFIFPTPNS